MADMDNQPTQNLDREAAIKKMKELAEHTPTCMFITKLNSFPNEARPMALQEVDDAGVFWFISSTESNKNHDIENDNRVQLTFQNDSKYEYMTVYGEAHIHTDKALIEKYWTDFANAWFEGKDDPRVTIVSVDIKDGYYWDTKDGKFISLVKMSYSALTGSKLNDGGVEGVLHV